MKQHAYRYTPDGFEVYGGMRRLWASHESVKIAGGTYDAGKTYSLCAYIDALAMKYPGCADDVCASESEPCVSEHHPDLSRSISVIHRRVVMHRTLRL